MAARLSYDDSRKQFMEITGIEIPKRTIHSILLSRRLEVNSRKNKNLFPLLL